MKRIFLVSILLGLLFGATGCSTVSSTFSPTPRKNTVALSISVDSIGQPNAAQWAALVSVLEPQLKAKGWVLVHDLSKASQILRVNFIPDPMAPDLSGQIVVVGMMANPRTAPAPAMAFNSSFPSSSSFSRYGSGAFGMNDYDYYNGYMDRPTFTPPPVIITPPSNIPHCPPDLDRPHRSSNGGGYARNESSPNWSSSNRDSSYSSPSYSSPEPSYTPASAPEPVSSGLNYTPSSDSSAATHPTSG